LQFGTKGRLLDQRGGIVKKKLVGLACAFKHQHNIMFFFGFWPFQMEIFNCVKLLCIKMNAYIQTAS
jgi:hypothetical protein